MNQVLQPPLAAPRPLAAARSLYIVLALLMSAMVLWGFWPYWSSLPGGGASPHWVVTAHAAVFSGWMLMLVTQASLVYRGEVRAHRVVGRVGIAVGGLVVVTGLMITLVAPGLNVAAGRMTLDQAAGFLILPIGDLAAFVAFFAAAIHYRQRPELHKRLILLATVALVFPAAARGAWEWGVIAVMVIWLSPLFIAMGHDLVVRGRIERVYFIGLAVLLASAARIPLMESETWIAIARPLVSVPV